MAEPLSDKIMRKVKQLDELYHRLMLVVAPSGAGKTTALQDVRDRTGAPLVKLPPPEEVACFVSPGRYPVWALRNNYFPAEKQNLLLSDGFAYGNQAIARSRQFCWPVPCLHIRRICSIFISQSDHSAP